MWFKQVVKQLFPQDKLKHWSANGADFEFQLQGLPQIGMTRTAFTEEIIRFKSAAGAPISFEIFVDIKPTDHGAEFYFAFTTST